MKSNNTATATTIKKIEHRVRPYLYSFCFFVFLFQVLKAFTSDVFKLELPSWVLWILGVIIGFQSIQMGPILRELIENIFNDEEEDMDFSNLSPQAAWLVRFIGIGLLYFLVQSGLLLLIFPEAQQIEWQNVPLYIPFFLSNCFLIFEFYREYIFE